MCQKKKSYKVFQQTKFTYTDTGIESVKDVYIGSTYAVSPKQAVNNVLYRKNLNKYDYCDGPCYHREVNYYAKEVVA